MGQKILILGAAGMLGHTLLSELSKERDMAVLGAARSLERLSESFQRSFSNRLLVGLNVNDFESTVRALVETRPDVVINCIGIVKQVPMAKDPLVAIGINALFPRRLALVCKSYGTRLIHISTDCVFSGLKGNYKESDVPDPSDLYGRSKFLGEIDCENGITLRTSLIGHELRRKSGLLEWFLSQQGPVNGFTRAIFSGFPTVEMARIIVRHVIPQRQLSGLLHVSSDPISKYNLLRLVAEKYGKALEIYPTDEICVDRSLDSTKFREATGYVPPSWPHLVASMRENYLESIWYRDQHN